MLCFDVEVEVRAGGRCEWEWELELEMGKVAHAARRNAMRVIYELRAQVRVRVRAR